ncbi:type IV toxin-antitoxin system AbiEi family antitoxin domain-containing protein [Blastococcus sp. TF02A-30]|uniref:type IV toxin-antitoxin system AbiEi family antitoxin domain-containing protein n=1 Tax=Blastococcus sp. TF02A-30 TaxID=2250580 RepID=UPI000DEB98A8|nr:type IV toxin-antitoxin system AbiEi family antitoxin domain-containing protein [Blastococcus sp. TF02A-30]RBY92894.1 hypothetical protein DQ241_02325 [Blastococcus sp. TF02A-30]
MHPLLRARADRQLGLFTALDARTAGYGHGEIRSLCTTGAWVRVRRGVYALADEHAAALAGGRAHALAATAVLLDLGRPDTVVSHSSAFRLLGLPARRALLPDTVRLTHPTLWRRGQGFTVNRAPLPVDDVRQHPPLWLTTPARTLVDCGREWPLEDAVIGMDAALLAEKLSPAQLHEAVTRAEGWPGARRAARAAGLADGRAESPLETRGRLRMIGAGLPVPELQVEIRVQGRLLGVVDAWFEEAALAVEFDGQVKYTDPWRGRTAERVLWEEKRREDAMRAVGIRFVRVVDADMGAGWPEVETRLAQLLSTPGPPRRTFTATPRPRGVVRTA